MRISLFFTALMIAGGLTVSVAQADSLASSPNVDLVLPANLASADAPFYQEAQVKIGNELIPVRQGNLPSGVLAQYQPENKAVVVSDATGSSEADKGKA